MCLTQMDNKDGHTVDKITFKLEPLTRQSRSKKIVHKCFLRHSLRLPNTVAIGSS